RHDAAGAQRLPAVVAGLRLYAVDRATGRQRGRGQRATRQQPATAEADEQRVERANVLEELERRGPLAGDDGGVVVRREQRQRALGGEPARERLAILCKAVVGDDLAAVFARGGELGRGRVRRHDDRRAYAEFACGERDRLRVV